MFHEGSRLNANVRRSVQRLPLQSAGAFLGFLVCVVIHAGFSSQQSLPPYQIPKFVLPQHFPSLSSQQARAPFYFRWAITSFTAVRISWIVCLGSLAPKMAVPATRTLEPVHKDQSCAPNLIKPAICLSQSIHFQVSEFFSPCTKKKKKQKKKHDLPA